MVVPGGRAAEKAMKLFYLTNKLAGNRHLEKVGESI
jgi:hypothetical protein